MSPVGECLEKGELPSVGHCPPPPIPNACLPLLHEGSCWLLHVISAFPGESLSLEPEGSARSLLCLPAGRPQCQTDGTGLAPKARPGPSLCIFLLSGVINVL